MEDMLCGKLLWNMNGAVSRLFLLIMASFMTGRTPHPFIILETTMHLELAHDNQKHGRLLIYHSIITCLIRGIETFLEYYETTHHLV